MMNYCKNPDCQIKINDKRTYCSLSCRNVYVNKYIRDYKKTSDTQHYKHKIAYEKNPKYCLNCDHKIPYSKKQNNFCNRSCAASYTNKGRDGTQRTFSENGLKNIKLSNKLKPKRIKNTKLHNNLKQIDHNNPYNLIKKNTTINKQKLYEKNPKYCLNCNHEIPYKKRKNKYCNKTCRRLYEQKNRTDFREYYLKCQFDFRLFDYPEEFDFDLITKYGWYKAAICGNNLNGVSRDHIYSINDGYHNNVNPYYIKHPANCQLLLQSENSIKHSYSHITIDELKRRVKEWDQKYMK